MEEAERRIKLGLELIDRYRQDTFTSVVKWAQWSILTFQGRWEAARRVIEEDITHKSAYANRIKVIDAQVGALEDFSGADAIGGEGELAYIAMTWMCRRNDKEIIGSLADLDWDSGLRNQFRSTAAVMGAIQALIQGGEDQLSNAYDELVPFEGQWSPYLGISVDHILGLLSSAEDDWPTAESHMKKALISCRNAGFNPTVAYLNADYADVLLDHDALNNREQASQLQDEAIAIAKELGMKPLLERVLAKREILKA